MCPVANDLIEGDALPDGDEIARYCKPSAYDSTRNEPSHLAFLDGDDAKDVSVNRLQHFPNHDRTGAVNCIRREVGAYYKLRPNGRFLVLNVADAKKATQRRGLNVTIIYTPKFFRSSHASIGPLPTDYAERVKLAVALVRLITPVDTYPGVV